MKRLLYTLAIFWLMALAVTAQDFKLYYAKNVTNVTDFSSTRRIAQQLTWKEVVDGAIDGNAVDVKAVTDMLKDTRMKGLEDQELFWRMRDETLLAFRINDGSGKTGIYEVEVDYGVKTDEGNPYKLTLNTTSYFFANMPLFSSDHHVTVTVKKKGGKGKPIVFRYWVYDWDNENVYIFQLDQKRQSTGNTYGMEYVTTYTDAEGKPQYERNTLQLRSTCFQSFYVPKGHTLTDVYFVTGNENEGYDKMRMNMEFMHSGIDIDNKMEIPRLETMFNLTKHENRELMNFNWLGTGLFERYDTLFLQLFTEDGERITNANINVHRVDGKGNYIDDESLSYLGYDAASRSHLVHTYAHHAYVEILVPGCLPMLYRYKGAAAADSRILDEELCTAKLTLKAGQPDASGIAISDQYLRYMDDIHVAVTRDSIDYAVCEEQDFSLSGRLPVETISFMDNGGTEYPKLFNNDPTEKFAQMEVAFSSPKGSAAPSCSLTAREVESGRQITLRNISTEIVSSKVFTHFTRDYFFTRYDLTDDLPYNTEVALTLQTPTSTYEGFPRLCNVYFNQEEQEKEVEEHAQESVNTPNDADDASRAFEDGGFGFGTAPEFNLKISNKFTIKTGSTIDISQQLFQWYIQLVYNGVDPDQDQGKKKTARTAAKNYSNWNKTTYKFDEAENQPLESASMTLAGGSEKLDDWAAKEANRIFQVNANHIGWYFGGGARLAIQAKLPKFRDFQISEFSGYLEGGFGWFWAPPTNGKIGTVKKVTKLVPLDLDFGAVFDLNVRLDAALMSFNKKAMSKENMGFFAGLGGTARAGGWFGIKVKRNPIADCGINMRAGAKLSAEAGVAKPFMLKEYGLGTRFTLLALIEAHIYLRSFCCHMSYQMGWKWGKQFFIPNNGHNPYHKDFPYWIPKDATQSTVANAYRPVRAPKASDMGYPLVTDVAINANPHFIDDHHVVYNAMGAPSDYNDDHVAICCLEEGGKHVNVSSPGLAAAQQMRSKCGEPEVVAYQQVCSTVVSEEINDDNALQRTLEQNRHVQIKAAMRRGADEWTETVVTPDDGYLDQNPVVTVQQDGKAALVYQHGEMTLINDTLPKDSLYSYALQGELLLRTYEPATGWSEPTRLFDINPQLAVNHYDLIMRGDTVLVGASIYNALTDSVHMYYASKPLRSNKVTYVDEQISPYSFFMNRVGKHAVIAMAYERSDSVREVFVKTLSMDGYGDGHAGCDIGVDHCTPDRVKIICDRSNDNAQDFAVLWTEANNVIRDPAEGSYSTDSLGTVLNASRIHLSDTPAVTYPLTVAAATDSLQLIDFDGFLNDDRVAVVYSLADPNGGGAVIMKNEKVFTNGFEADVTYSREALLASASLPVNVTISNTGTSSINGAEVVINGTTLPIEDAFVAPLTKKSFTVNYPLTDEFDGYMESEVHVFYDNVFRNSSQTTRLGKHRNLRRGVKAFERELVAYNDIDCRIVNRHIDPENGVNTFLIELTDRSTYGLLPNTGLLLGIHPRLGVTETITHQAQTLVTDADFHQVGNRRKAYATVYVSGITEVIDGYIFPTIVNLRALDSRRTIVENATAGRNASAVTLFPSDDPTYIDALRYGRAVPTHHTLVERYDGGIRLSGIQEGSNVRVFGLGGYLLYNEPKAAGTTLNIPLSTRGIYIISTGNEIFKYSYE